MMRAISHRHQFKLFLKGVTFFGSRQFCFLVHQVDYKLFQIKVFRLVFYLPGIFSIHSYEFSIDKYVNQFFFLVF